jgi:predicted ABC-type ATPase
MSVPRLRMFAGPNGSGKSTLKTVVPPHLLERYLNPDDIEADIRRTGHFDLSAVSIAATATDVRDYFERSAFLASAGLTADAGRLDYAGNRVGFGAVPVNSYFASVLVDFLRRQLLAANLSFSFETVMSAPDKVELLRLARAAGYRTYLYFVATDDPAINIARVRQRVRAGGHDVPADKIVARYHRSLELAPQAVRHASRAYFFDNSGAELVWLAEITDGRSGVLEAATVNEWFRAAVWDKLAEGER